MWTGGRKKLEAYNLTCIHIPHAFELMYFLSHSLLLDSMTDLQAGESQIYRLSLQSKETVLRNEDEHPSAGGNAEGS